MNICMFTPSERAMIQELLREYDTARSRLMAALDVVEEEWIAEITNVPEFDYRYGAATRLSILRAWIMALENKGGFFEEIEDDE
jgi:hypothetical protein